MRKQLKMKGNMRLLDKKPATDENEAAAFPVRKAPPANTHLARMRALGMMA
jgi:hypothetical protein